jgi:hypothetical protein
MPSAAASTLADLGRVLEALGLRWYLFGAQAAIHYGSPRVTADVDVTVDLGALSPSTLVARLGEVGIEPRIALDEDFMSRARVLPLWHRPTGMGVDVVLAGPGPEELFLDRARDALLDGVAVRIAAPNDIVVMKVLAGRPKDFDDIVGILRKAPAGFEENDVRTLLSELEGIAAVGRLEAAGEAHPLAAGADARH